MLLENMESILFLKQGISSPTMEIICIKGDKILIANDIVPDLQYYCPFSMNLVYEMISTGHSRVERILTDPRALIILHT